MAFFKSNGSYKIPAETREHIPILSEPNDNNRPVRTLSIDPDEVVIKIAGEDSPPSKLVGRFAKQHKEGNGEISFDADFEMGDFRDFQNPKGFVSKPQAPSSMNGGRNKNDNNADASIGDDEGEINEQKDNSRFPYMSAASEGNKGSGLRRETILSRTNTKSRLEDPVEIRDRWSGRMGISNQMKSGMLAKSGQVDEEDDFLLEEDIPNNYKNMENLNALTLIQWVSLAFIVITLVCTLSISKWREKNLRGLEMGPRVRPARVASTQNSGALTSKKQDDGIPIDHLHKLNPKNISAWNMKRWMNIVRHGVMSTLDEQILDSTHEDDSTRQIRSEVEAKVAARKIFRNVAKADSKFICLEDLMRFLQEKEALKTMSLLEGSSECEKISKSSLKNWVVKAFSERRALALTLNDTKTAVKKLHKMVNVYIESKKDHWHPAPTIVVMSLVGLNMLKMSLWPKHRMNHQDMGEKFARRTLLIEEMVKIIKELDTEYRLRPIDINVRSLPPTESSQLASAWTIC
ncbi:hypothetical protein RJ639_005952 [Escallonia herrerae]|uniref:Uncharacterized protein n=1 Tax=Escallonia herrerae TaxID=1293975 RepID=A0AA88VWN6_9ASTE|nr:hypothetical protein RJ639_005952 [Escallonia herrerae]